MFKHGVWNDVLATPARTYDPGAPNFEAKAQWTIPVDVEALAVTPHMHMIGRDMRMWVTFPDGRMLSMSAVIVDSQVDGTTVNDEGQIKGSGHTRGDLIEMGAGTAGGLTIGALAGGAKGAFIGAAIGGGATAIHWLTKHHSTELPAGTELVMEISSPMTLSAGGGAGR